MPIQALWEGGRDGFETTGNQGTVMKESMRIARTLVRRLYAEVRTGVLRIPGLDAERAAELPDLPEKMAWHIHVPDGATPKDGPSAGFAIVLAMLSTLVGVPIRDTLAFTGEVDLVGNILAIGGLDKKLMGCVTEGVKTVCLSEENRRDMVVLYQDAE